MNAKNYFYTFLCASLLFAHGIQGEDKLIDFSGTSNQKKETTGSNSYGETPSYILSFRKKITKFSCAQLNKVSQEFSKQIDSAKTHEDSTYYLSLLGEIKAKQESNKCVSK